MSENDMEYTNNKPFSQGPWVLGDCYRGAIFKFQVDQGVGVCDTCIHADRQTDRQT